MRARRFRVPAILLALALALTSLIASGALAAEPRAPAATAAAADASHDHASHDHSATPATGSDVCAAAGMIALPDGTCTHGGDETPPTLDLDAAVPLVQFHASALPAGACTGTGSDGPRVQVIYARASDRTDGYAASLATLRSVSEGVNSVFVNSAAKTGGVRHLRFVHDAGCNVDVANVVLSPSGDDSFGNTVNELKAQGFDRSDRKYLVFVDVTGILCGIANLMPDEDKAAIDNLNSAGGMYARVDRNCWTANVAAHEVMHNLGAVQDNAPHSTSDVPVGNPGGHCTDDYDVMCYSDWVQNGQSVPPMVITCAGQANESLFDCMNDDYFHTNPTGGYLSTHWNTADNPFLNGGTTIACPDFYSYESDNYWNWASPIAVNETQQHAFCRSADDDWVSFDATAGTQYTLETLNLASGVDTEISLWRANGNNVQWVASDDNGAGGLASRIQFNATFTGKHYLWLANKGDAGNDAYTFAVRLIGPNSDTTPPVVGKPLLKLVLDGPVGAAGAPVSVSWTSSDAGSGVASHQLQQSTNGGGWQDVTLANPTATSVALALATGASYRFQLRATDSAGNTSAWKVSVTRTLGARQETSANISWQGSWASFGQPGAWGGNVQRSRTTGDSATLTFSGTGIGVVVTKGPNRGRAEVWLDGAKAGTIDLYAASETPAQLVFVRNTLVAGSHTLELRLITAKTPASTGRWVHLDGFVVVQ